MADVVALRNAMNASVSCLQCGAGTPSAIICTRTANFGKWFRACSNPVCRQFLGFLDIQKWLFENGFPSDAWMLVQPTAPATPPPSSQPRPGPSQQAYGSAPAPSQPTFFSQPPPSSQQQQQSSSQRITCRNDGCNNPGAKQCTVCFCKQCCVASGAVCKIAKHNEGGDRPVFTPNPDIHFARPMPVIPLAPHVSQPNSPFPIDPILSSPSSASASPSTDVTSLASEPEIEIVAHSYRKPVSTAWAQDHIKRREEQERQLRDKAEKTRNELALAHRVVVIAFLSAGEQPRHMFSSQIRTWPTLDLGKLILDLGNKLGVSSASEMDVCYFLSNNAGPTWFDADHTMTVQSNQKIFLRRTGLAVDDEDLFREHRAQLSTVASPTHLQRRSTVQPGPTISALLSTSAASLKRPASFTDGDPRPAKQQHLDLDASSSEPDPCLASVPSSSVSPAPPVDEPLIIDIPDDGDDCWSKGYVVTNPGAGTWPKGMYVRDVAKAFTMMEGGSDSTVPQRFEAVFPGYTYSKSTFFRNRKFWKQLPSDARRLASNLPRDTKDDLWINWRGKQALWKTIT